MIIVNNKLNLDDKYNSNYSILGFCALISFIKIIRAQKDELMNNYKFEIYNTSVNKYVRDPTRK